MAKAKSHSTDKTETLIATSEPALPSADTATSAGEGRSRVHAPESASTAVEAPGPKVTKLGQIRALLAAPAGASLPALCAATGWQSHSVRAALTGLRKAGEAVEKSKAEDGATVYRLVSSAEAGE